MRHYSRYYGRQYPASVAEEAWFLIGKARDAFTDQAARIEGLLGGGAVPDYVERVITDAVQEVIDAFNRAEMAAYHAQSAAEAEADDE